MNLTVPSNIFRAAVMICHAAYHMLWERGSDQLFAIAAQSVDVLLCIVLCDDGVAGINYGINLLAVQILDHGLNCHVSHVVGVLSV